MSCSALFIFCGREATLINRNGQRRPKNANYANRHDRDVVNTQEKKYGIQNRRL